MLDLLENRTSVPAVQLSEPAPSKAQLERILRCGLTAPDHANLCPWRFITIQGDARIALGEVFAAAALKENPHTPAEKIARMQQKPLRSPMIIVIVATITADHPKTPEIEQVLSAGAAATLIQLAATASGFDSIWLTGPNTYNEDVKAALGVSKADQIVGFFYIGTPLKAAALKPRPDLSEHVSEWSAPFTAL